MVFCSSSHLGLAVHLIEAFDGLNLSDLMIFQFIMNSLDIGCEVVMA